jgi:HlyD family secretion protein
MDKIKYTTLSLLIALNLVSCSSKKENKLKYQGQVKHETISISSKLGGRIKKLYVQEGQNVKKGDTLVFIDIPEVDAKLIQANGAIEAAKGQLEMAHNGATKEQLKQIDGKINAAKAQLNFAKKSYQRLNEMFKDSLIPKQKLDEVGMKLKMAKSQVSALEAKKNEVKNGARKEQIKQAKGQLERALGAKQEVLSAKKEKFLIAPTNMSIETISLKEGELLTPGYTLISGYKKDGVYVRFTIPESDIYKFKVNQELTLFNPYTKKDIKGKVTRIKSLAKYATVTSSYPKDQIDESMFEIKIKPIESSNKEPFYQNAKMLLK